MFCRLSMKQIEGSLNFQGLKYLCKLTPAKPSLMNLAVHLSFKIRKTAFYWLFMT